MLDVCCLCEFVSLSLGFEGNKRCVICVCVQRQGAAAGKKRPLFCWRFAGWQNFDNEMNLLQWHFILTYMNYYIENASQS